MYVSALIFSYHKSYIKILHKIAGPDARARLSSSGAMKEMLSLMCEQLSSTSQKKGLLQPYTKCFRNLLLLDKYYSIVIGVRLCLLHIFGVRTCSVPCSVPNKAPSCLRQIKNITCSLPCRRGLLSWVCQFSKFSNWTIIKGDIATFVNQSWIPFSHMFSFEWTSLQ